MARRGDQLREHILWAAKEVFLEMGFERASMDLVAGRAKTSKRSLYAHFESKEKLFLAVIEMVRGLFLTRLKEPGDYSDKPAEALVRFCGQYIQAILYGPSVRMCRISMSESERFPEQAALYFDVLFTQVHARLSAYLKKTFRVSTKVSAAAAHALLGQILFPRHTRALFGLDPLAESFDDEAQASDFDLKPIQNAVSELMQRFAG
jgi:AcrR family transcriptional regulator